MSSFDDRTLAEDVLARAVDDWVGDAEIIHLVRRSGVQGAESARDLAVGLTSRLLVTGLVVAGELTDSGHAPWEGPIGETIERITAEWAARAEPFVRIGEIFWLAATPEGLRIGEAVLARESPPPDR